MTGVASTAKRRSLITILILLQCSYAIPPPRRGHVPRPRKRQNVQMVVDESTGETKEWTPAVSLELFEQRKQHGPPLTRRDRHHEVALRRQVMQQYYDDKREAERLIEEAKKPRKPHPLLCGTTPYTPCFGGCFGCSSMFGGWWWRGAASSAGTW